MTLQLNLGCGATVPAGWVNVDYSLGAKLYKIPIFGGIIRRLKIFNVEWSKEIVLHDLTKEFPWDDNSVDVVYTSHTLEHLTKSQGRDFLRECFRVLKPGGILRVLVPDLRVLVDSYVSGELRADDVLEKLLCLYRFSNSKMKNTMVPYLQFPHKCMYDTATLLDVMHEIGFEAESRAGLDSDIANIEEIEQPGRTVDAVIVESRKPTN